MPSGIHHVIDLLYIGMVARKNERNFVSRIIYATLPALDKH